MFWRLDSKSGDVVLTHSFAFGETGTCHCRESTRRARSEWSRPTSEKLLPARRVGFMDG